MWRYSVYNEKKCNVTENFTIMYIIKKNVEWNILKIERKMKQQPESFSQWDHWLNEIEINNETNIFYSWIGITYIVKMAKLLKLLYIV